MLKTERLRIRQFHESDLEDFELLIRDKMSSKYAPYDIPWPVDNFRDILVCLINDDAWHAVELIEKSKVIGFVVASRTEDETIRDLGFDDSFSLPKQRVCLRGKLCFHGLFHKRIRYQKIYIGNGRL